MAKKGRLTLLVLAVAAVAAIAGCARKERYIVAVTPNYPPVAMITQEKTIAGYDIDVIRRIAETGNMNIRIIPVLEGNLLHGLIDETYDIAIGAIVPTGEQYAPEQMNISYSKPYLDIGDVLVTSEDVKDFGGLGQLAGKRVGVLPRSAAVDILRSRGKAVVREFQTPEEAFDALALGKIYAVCVDLLTAAQFVKLNDEYRRIFKIYHDPVTRKEYVIAVKGGKSSLLNKINSGIDRMKREGALNTLVDKWFFQE